MQLTDHELAAASSFVAALAIAGGYLGVRSANRSALAIAREERSTRSEDELNALRRVSYIRCLATLTALAQITHSDREETMPADADVAVNTMSDPSRAAYTAIADIRLLAPPIVSDLAQTAFQAALTPNPHEYDVYVGAVSLLQVVMKMNLDGERVPDLAELGVSRKELSEHLAQLG